MAVLRSTKDSENTQDKKKILTTAACGSLKTVRNICLEDQNIEPKITSKLSKRTMVC